jgi:hypothetical protein
MPLIRLPSSGLAAAWGLTMAFDILIFGMTVHKSFTTYRRITSLENGLHGHWVGEDLKPSVEGYERAKSDGGRVASPRS